MTQIQTGHFQQVPILSYLKIITLIQGMKYDWKFKKKVYG